VRNGSLFRVSSDYAQPSADDLNARLLLRSNRIIFMKNGKTAVVVFGLLFGGIGLGLILGALYTFDHTRSFKAKAMRAEGKVKELVLSRSGTGSRRSATYSPLVEFDTADGQRIQFTGSVSSNPPAYRPGQQVGVLYLPDDPYSAGIDSFWQQWFLAVLLAGMGSVFATVGIAPIMLAGRAARRQAWLRREGKVVQARIQGVEQSGGVRVGGQRPYQIVSHWLDPVSGKLHVFRSEGIWFNPIQYIDREQVTVLIDPENPKHYVVDVGFLPELADG
jgi:hypothetical protein